VCHSHSKKYPPVCSFDAGPVIAGLEKAGSSGLSPRFDLQGKSLINGEQQCEMLRAVTPDRCGLSRFPHRFSAVWNFLDWNLQKRPNHPESRSSFMSSETKNKCCLLGHSFGSRNRSVTGSGAVTILSCDERSPAEMMTVCVHLLHM